MKLLFLGTGTSTGVPQIGCHCPTCRSLDPVDKRLRTSALLSVEGKNILIDCGPDFREQMLRAKSPSLDALILTHIHFDHIGGIEDLRPFSYKLPFRLYCKKDVAAGLHERLPYCFKDNPYPGAPSFDIKIIEPYKPFYVDGVEIMPLPVMHYQLEILGFKVGNMAYITDCKTMPKKTIDHLKGIDTLVLNALRHSDHISHLSLSEAIDLVNVIKPKKTYFTHFSHQIGPAATVKLPNGMHLAHDFMEIEI